MEIIFLCGCLGIFKKFHNAPGADTDDQKFDKKVKALHNNISLDWMSKNAFTERKSPLQYLDIGHNNKP